MEFIKEFFLSTPITELIIILVAKAIEVSMGTLRHILVNKGFRKQGAGIAFFEIILWVFIASTVITGIASAPIKGVVYSLGYASGVLLGSAIEKRLAFGKVLIQTITSKELGPVIADTLRAQGYGVTSIEAKGKEADKIVLMVYANRKGNEVIFDIIQNIDHEAMIVSNDVSTLQGGYVTSWRRIAK